MRIMVKEFLIGSEAKAWLAHQVGPMTEDHITMVDGMIRGLTDGPIVIADG